MNNLPIFYSGPYKKGTRIFHEKKAVKKSDAWGGKATNPCPLATSLNQLVLVILDNHFILFQTALISWSQRHGFFCEL